MCSRPKVDSPRKRKPSALQRPVGDKRARSIRDPDPPLTVNVESDEAERMYPGLIAEAQGHCVGVSGMRDVPTAQQVRLLARDVTQVLFTSSNDQGSNGQGSNDQGSNGQASTSHHAPSVVTDDDTGVTGHDENDYMGDKRARSIRYPDPPLTVKVEPDEAERMYPGLTAEAQGHCVGVSGMMDVSTAQQVRLLARDVTQALFTSSNDQGSNGQASTSHHAPSVVTDDDTGVTGHDENDYMGDKRARSIRYPDPPLTVKVEPDEAERMYPGLTAEAQGHCVGVSGMMDVSTAQQVRLLARDVTQAIFTSSNDQGSNGQASTSHHAPSVVTDDDMGVTEHDEDDDKGVTRHDDTGVTGHDEDDDTGITGHDEDDDTGVTGHDEDDDTGVIAHDEDDDTGVTGHDEDDDTGVTGHDADDDTGVTGHDEDDDTGVTGEQAAESSEQLRRFHRFRGTVHTLLRFLVIEQTRGSLPHLPADVGPLEEIEDYVQRVLTSHCLSFE